MQPVPDCMLYQQEHMQHSIPSESRYASEDLTVGPFILQILSPTPFAAKFGDWLHLTIAKHWTAALRSSCSSSAFPFV